VGYDQLEFPVEMVRDAGRILPSSPVYGLLQTHMARLGHTPDVLARGPAGALLGKATVDLVRAMIASTVPAESSRHAAAITDETMLTQIVTYLRAHLRDPGLRAEQIASDLHISVRHLYRQWASQDPTLAEWVMIERLEGARHALANQSARSTTIRTVARAWGFADATHFSRRFRSAYGMSPDDWRRASRAQGKPTTGLSIPRDSTRALTDAGSGTTDDDGAGCAETSWRRPGRTLWRPRWLM
jgi:AraC-like DNA-binding protein